MYLITVAYLVDLWLDVGMEKIISWRSAQSLLDVIGPAVVNTIWDLYAPLLLIFSRNL